SRRTSGLPEDGGGHGDLGASAGVGVGAGHGGGVMGWGRGCGAADPEAAEEQRREQPPTHRRHSRGGVASAHRPPTRNAQSRLKVPNRRNAWRSVVLTSSSPTTWSTIPWVSRTLVPTWTATLPSTFA